MAGLSVGWIMRTCWTYWDFVSLELLGELVSMHVGKTRNSKSSVKSKRKRDSSILWFYGCLWGCCNGTSSSAWMNCLNLIAAFWRWWDNLWKIVTLQSVELSILSTTPPRSCLWRVWIHALAVTTDIPLSNVSVRHISGINIWEKSLVRY